MRINIIFIRLTTVALTVSAALFACAPVAAPAASYGVQTDAVTTAVTYAQVTDGTSEPAATESETDTGTIPNAETSAEADTTFAETAADTGSAAAETAGYIVVPRFFNLGETEAESYLSGYGITASVEYDCDASAKGTVFDVAFSGYWDDENLYIKPGYTVTLKISLGEEPASGDKVAYLSFDDGPTKENTYKILDILSDYDAKATFFVVGSSVARFPGRVKAIYDAGQAIGCHSYSHVYTDIYASKDAFLADMQRWNDAVSAELGDSFSCTLYRMPGGSANAKKYDSYGAVRDTLSERGCHIIDWTMANNDVWSATKAGSLTAVDYEKQCFEQQLDKLDAAGRPVIILMHETYGSTVEMLPWAIELLENMGYGFGTLDNYGGDYFQ